MLYTGKGDKGTTKTLNTPERIPKDSAVIEALGAVDELNAWLGYCRVKFNDNKLSINNEKLADILLTVQENLFIIQGELAGADLSLTPDKITELETIINEIETKLAPINSFIIPGGTELSALCDFGRTIARRAEREIVALMNNGKISDTMLAYTNRLSSLLYALARYANQVNSVDEQAPSYK